MNVGALVRTENACANAMLGKDRCLKPKAGPRHTPNLPSNVKNSPLRTCTPKQRSRRRSVLCAASNAVRESKGAATEPRSVLREADAMSYPFGKDDGEISSVHTHQINGYRIRHVEEMCAIEIPGVLVTVVGKEAAQPGGCLASPVNVGGELLREQTGEAAVPVIERNSTKVFRLGRRFKMVNGRASICVTDSGRFELHDEVREGMALLPGVSVFPRLVVSGRLTLPKACSKLRSDELMVEASDCGAIYIRWGQLAWVRLVPTGHEYKTGERSPDSNWANDMDSGFVMEYCVRHCGGTNGTEGTAEIALDMASAGQWFGGAHMMRQHWPLNRASMEVAPYYPFDNGPTGLNTLVGSHWVTSRGLLCMLDPDVAFLHVGLNAAKDDPDGCWVQRFWGVGVQNLTKELLPNASDGRGDGLVRLQARNSFNSLEVKHPLSTWVPPAVAALMNGKKNKEGTGASSDRKGNNDSTSDEEVVTSLRVALAVTKNVKEATLLGLRQMRTPPRVPDEGMMGAPIWTTWARYHHKVTQAKVLAYADEIVERQLPRSVMEIDDRWQSKYGDFDFDADKFSHPEEMVKRLHEQGFKVTVWVMPFAEESSQAYREGAPKGYFIKSDTSNGFRLSKGFFHWWNTPPVVALDVTNPEALDWFVSRLKAAQARYGLDGFKFDAGEPCFLPRDFKSHAPLVNPAEYAQRYVEGVASHFPTSEVRTGHKSTHVPVMTRMGDRFSTWSIANGLQSVIPTLLTSGILGYPFCLPDMVGGNAYFGAAPDSELIVRWAQANALMPAVQFSIAPWDISEEADRLCAAALKVRERILAKLMSLARQACIKLTPICVPMWWLDPEDEETYAISDQFALGHDVIVAPVVEKGQRSRNVYLTSGLWQDLMNPSKIFQGPCWLPNFDAPLSRLPVFLRVLPHMGEHR